MESQKIMNAMEIGIIKNIQEGSVFKIPHDARIDISEELRKAYKNIDYDKVYARITQLLEEELAIKVVNKIITEMGNDIKALMSNKDIREDFKYLMRKGVETIMESVKK